VADARGAYDPVRDLAVLLHAALRQGHWGPAALGALRRLEEHLAPAGGFALASDIEARLRGQLAGPGRSRADLDEEAAAAAARQHEDAAAFRAEMAAAEPDLDGFVERTLAKTLPEENPVRRILEHRAGPPAGYSGAI
jgi:hypothetical protein